MGEISRNCPQPPSTISVGASNHTATRKISETQTTTRRVYNLIQAGRAAHFCWQAYQCYQDPLKLATVAVQLAPPLARMTGSEGLARIATSASKLVTAYNSTGAEIVLSNLTPVISQLASQQIIQQAGIENAELKDGIEIALHEFTSHAADNLHLMSKSIDTQKVLTGKRKRDEEGTALENPNKKSRTSDMPDFNSGDATFRALASGFTDIL